LPPPPTLTLAEAAFLHNALAFRRDRHYAVAVTLPGQAPLPPATTAEEGPGLTLEDGSEIPIDESVNLAFDRLERGVK
jgi:hypothetical protein